MPSSNFYLPSRGLVSNQQAAIIEPPHLERSVFTNRKQRLTAINAGDLVPFHVEEILPGDHVQFTAAFYTRMATPLFPIFSNQRLQTWWFFIPNRLAWEHWVNFMGEQANPSDSIAYTIPTITLPARTGANANDLYDQMGIPNQNTGGGQYVINALPARGYNRVWNEWFRDQNVENSATFVMNDGPDTAGWYNIAQINKMHDYFTSCLPWPQKFTAPTISLGTRAPVGGIQIWNNNLGIAGTGYDSTNLTGTTNYTNSVDIPDTITGGAQHINIQQHPSGWPDIYADLSQATGITINAFRQAFMIQTLLERDARGGTRYIELIKSHFGVINPDFRLQRTEYIGGGTQPLMTTPVAQTAPSTGATVGALGAATTSFGSHSASYAATEHGYILGLVAVRTEQLYQQGLHKMWTRSTRYDFYDPALAHLGEQAVTQGELYAIRTGADATIFGYQERWHEYRTMYSDTAGIFRSTTTLPLDAWHLGQKYGSAPTLGQSFLLENPPMPRILAAGNNAIGAEYLMDIMINRKIVRIMPAHGTPALLGRF